MNKLVILVCSTGKNHELGVKIEEEAKLLQFDTKLVNIANLKLPLYSYEEELKKIPSLAYELTQSLIDANSLVIIAPEYNGSMPPCLNNAIAWVSRCGDEWRKAFNGKATLIATHSGGGGEHALMAIRMQLSYIGANVLGRQIVTNSKKALNIKSLQSCLQQLQS